MIQRVGRALQKSISRPPPGLPTSTDSHFTPGYLKYNQVIHLISTEKTTTKFTSVLACGLTMAGIVSATNCTPTGFFRDNINMTAAVINPVGAVTGDVDATGCNIGVYYDHGKG